MKALMAALALVALPATAFAATSERDVLSHYADLAHAKYEDSLISARTLQGAVNQLIAEPTEANLAGAKDAWVAARVPYQQSEVYRFGNAVVDDWEGKVNAWPLDEGLIDYVAASYGAESEENPGYTANVIASPSFTFSGETIDAGSITKTLLADSDPPSPARRGEPCANLVSFRPSRAGSSAISCGKSGRTCIAASSAPASAMPTCSRSAAGPGSCRAKRLPNTTCTTISCTAPRSRTALRG